MSILLLPCLRFSGCKVIKKNVFSIIYCKKIVVMAIKKTIFGHAEVQPYIYFVSVEKTLMCIILW